MSDLAARRHIAGPTTVVDATLRDQELPTRGAAGAVHAGDALDGRYQLDELIGLGGTAGVYRGTDTLLDRTVAVKVFHSHLADLAMVARQRQEMQIVAGLRHPNLVLLHDARSRAHAPSYLVLEFVDGPTLARRVEQGPLDPQEVAGIGIGIAGALEAVHANGLVHRDVKPGNILLGADGEPKLSDFGIARVVTAERVTNSADVVGTAPYMSPEQARGNQVGPASDIYALGLVLLEALTGRREFPGAPVEAAVARLLRDPVIPDTLPSGWPSLLRRMTVARPDDRPPAAVVAAQLSTLRDGSIPIGNSPAGGRGRRMSRPRLLAGSGLAAVLAVAVTFGVLSAQDDDAPGAVPDPGPSRAPATEPSVAGTPVARQPPAQSGPTAASATTVQQVDRQRGAASDRSAAAAGSVTTPASAQANGAQAGTSAPRPVAVTPAQAPTAQANGAQAGTSAPRPVAVTPAQAPTAQPPAPQPPAAQPPNRKGAAKDADNGNGSRNGSGNGSGKGTGNGSGKGHGVAGGDQGKADKTKGAAKDKPAKGR